MLLFIGDTKSAGAKWSTLRLREPTFTPPSGTYLSGLHTVCASPYLLSLIPCGQVRVDRRPTSALECETLFFHLAARRPCAHAPSCGYATRAVNFGPEIWSITEICQQHTISPQANFVRAQSGQSHDSIITRSFQHVQPRRSIASNQVASKKGTSKVALARTDSCVQFNNRRARSSHIGPDAVERARSGCVIKFMIDYYVAATLIGRRAV